MSANSDLYDFFMIGDWSVEFHRLPDGVQVGRRAIVTVAWFLDSRAILDQWRHVDESGAVNFRGATFRTYLPEKDLWYMLWMTPEAEGFSELYARREGQEVHTSGKGRDTGGEFLERGKYWAITAKAFSFVLERSYDNGRSFAPFVAFRAARHPPNGPSARPTIMPVQPESRMDATISSEPNLRQAVPFFAVSNMETSLRFYIDGLGFEMADKWEDAGTVRWCRLVRGGAALMLQDFRRDGGKTWSPDSPLGLGVSIMFICSDALSAYREFTARGLTPSLPFVGNGMWVTSLRDPDGYSIEFESQTDVPEGTTFNDNATDVTA